MGQDERAPRIHPLRVEFLTAPNSGDAARRSGQAEQAVGGQARGPGGAPRSRGGRAARGAGARAARRRQQPLGPPTPGSRRRRSVHGTVPPAEAHPRPAPALASRGQRRWRAIPPPPSEVRGP